MIEQVKSTIPYDIGTIIQCDKTQDIFKVLSCQKITDHYVVRIEKHSNAVKNSIRDLKSAIESLDIHDKDLFMLENIISTLEDNLK